MDRQQVYSPTQAALGAFLGGPLASVIYLKQNFRALGDPDAESKTVMYGAIVLVALLGVLPFLPERFPNMAIPFATIIATRYIVDKHQFTKQSIVDSDSLEFHSNWRVFGIGLACMVVFFGVALGVILAFHGLGIARLD